MRIQRPFFHVMNRFSPALYFDALLVIFCLVHAIPSAVSISSATPMVLGSAWNLSTETGSTAIMLVIVVLFPNSHPLE